MGEPRELRLPRPPRWPAWAVTSSVALHAVALAVLILVFTAQTVHTPSGQFVGLLPVAASSAERTVDLLLPPSAHGAAPAVAASPSNSDSSVPPVVALMIEPPAPARVASDSLANWETSEEARPATWPSLASGLLWDRRPPPPTMLSRTHAERTDSAVKAILDHYLDSLAALPGGGKLLPPPWKATIAGEEYGVDGNYLTVAGLKIPAFVLGLIPLPVGGNESEALDKAGWMRAQDYELALPRDAAAADQKEQIKAIRKRMAAEQALRRQQQVAPAGKASE